MARMFALLLVGLLVLPVPGASAQDGAAGGPIVFSAGPKGGSYWRIAERFRALSAESGLKVKVEVRESAGSLENLERLAAPEDPVNLTLLQADALGALINRGAPLNEGLRILESIGRECVYIIADAKRGPKSFEALSSPDSWRVAIPDQRSGVAITLGRMQRLIPGLDRLEPVPSDTVKAMKQIHAGDEQAVDAVMLVQRPMLNNPEIHFAAAHPESFRVLSVTDTRLLQDRLPGGRQVYEFEDVPLTPERLLTGESVPTVCTPGLLVASEAKLGAELTQQLQRIVDFRWWRIDGPVR